MTRDDDDDDDNDDDDDDDDDDNNNNNNNNTENRPDIITKNKYEKTWVLIDVAIPADRIVVQKEGEN